MLRAFSLMLLTMLFLAAPARLFAWNDLGHMVAAKRAYDELADDPKLQLRLFDILKQHPHYDEFLAKNCPPGVGADEWAFLRASVWPDWIRPRTNDPRGPRVLKYHRAEDHYINLPFPAHSFSGKLTYPDPDKNDILCAYKQRAGEMRTKNVPDADKAVALCWFLHLIGDVHQPLHTTGMHSDEFPTGDLGGNLYGVKVNGKGFNLHLFWDLALGEVGNYLDDGPERMTKLHAKVKEISETLRDARYSRETLADDLTKHPNFNDWANESHELAKSVAYSDDGKFLVGKRIPGRVVPNDAPEVSAAYRPLAEATARRRIALSGYRIGDKLRLFHLSSK